jgi:broad specificity phosphatase PhoE
MEISLIRHGKSKLTKNGRMTCEEFNYWVEEYDNNGVFEKDAYPIETLEKIAKANIVITSDLKRSIDTARLLNPNLKLISDPLFHETELPIPSSNIWGLKISPSSWVVILRCLWFMGYSSGCESLSNAKTRAEKASEILVEYAREYRYVVLVGHGFFNMLVAKELQKMGLEGKKKANSKHWYATTYSLCR